MFILAIVLFAACAVYAAPPVVPLVPHPGALYPGAGGIYPGAGLDLNSIYSHDPSRRYLQGQYQGQYQGQGHYHGQGPEASARIIQQGQDVSPDGNFQWGFETDNGIQASAQGVNRPISPEEGIQAVQGSYSHPLPDGRRITVQYTADENGYKPVVTYQ